MPKKGRRARGKSTKWSRANIANLVTGGILAASMVLGSIFVFGGAATPTTSAPPPTSAIVATPTTIPALGPATPTAVVTPAK
ncbi:MAG: hypothetical protein WCF84_23950 [Anaerolineae bacterium]